MIVAGTPQQKKAQLFGGSRKSSPPATSSPAPAKHGKPISTARSQGCCRGINDCMSMGSIVSTNQQQQQHHRSTSKLEQQVEDLKLEVEKQKELRIMCRKRVERTQDYLRYCLQIAQENGFLELMINNKEGQHHQSLLSSNLDNINASPQPPIRSPSLQQNSDLSVTIDQAKMNGWYINPNEIELQEKIGQGSTAEIYRGIWRGLDVAVKCINPEFFQTNEGGVTFFAQELDTLCRQRHRFVLQLMGACLEPPDHGWVVTEFMSTTLKEWLHGRGNRRKQRTVPLPPFRERLAKAFEIAQAMQYLHEQKPKVCHRDLKPSNIFLDDACHVRVADFGHARFLTEEEMALTGETGTYVYMAPEVIRCEPYNEKCDVYSFGIILNELITGDHPYIETDYGPTRIAVEVGEGKLRPALPGYDGQMKELIKLIQLLWDGDASTRPAFSFITSALRDLQKKI
ncbi:hypothetical protein Ddye_020186 [Dipteronia dyeriana]|uniref:Protein kinase domain-containing protein n=1 Tax=Dipteronia dyeriana TaxID=168575 RepID=A0AAD9U030_9ROSI|nr:hypothetical protein Ddye_020186 [Dipteronia dyeriana]